MSYEQRTAPRRRWYLQWLRGVVWLKSQVVVGLALMGQRVAISAWRWAIAKQPRKEPPVEVASVLAKYNASPPSDMEGRASLPSLTDCMAPRYKDGIITRQPGRLTVRVEGSYYRISLDCPTEGLQTSLVVESLCGIFEAFEAALGSGKLAFTPNYESAKKGRRPVV